MYVQCKVENLNLQNFWAVFERNLKTSSKLVRKIEKPHYAPAVIKRRPKKVSWWQFLTDKISGK